jgi:hypothetical protein
MDGSAETLSRLEHLRNRYVMVSQARKMNAELKSRLMNRLAMVDAELFCLVDPGTPYPYSIFYEELSVWGIPDKELRRLVQSFWGKSPLEKSELSSESRSPHRSTDISPSAERLNFLNGQRNTRQRCLVGNSGPFHLALFRRSNLSVVDYRYAVIDLVRYLVMNSVFSDSICMRTVYPCMDVAKIRSIAKRIAKLDFEGKTLADYGIDPAAFQRTITLALRGPDAE